MNKNVLLISFELRLISLLVLISVAKFVQLNCIFVSEKYYRN